jgi:hypothetical protein
MKVWKKAHDEGKQEATETYQIITRAIKIQEHFNSNTSCKKWENKHD